MPFQRSIGSPPIQSFNLFSPTSLCDGKADILWRNTVTGQIYFWPMTGTTPTTRSTSATVDPAYDIVGTGDFDGDGKSDILWRHLTHGRSVGVADGRRDAAGPGVRRPVDPAYVVKGVGDLDANGKADIVWHHATLGEVWVWPMNGTTRLDQVWVGSVPDTGYQIQGVADSHGRREGRPRVAPRDAGRSVDLDDERRDARGGDVGGDGAGHELPDRRARATTTATTKADLLWRNVVNGEVWVWLMDGTGEAVGDVGGHGAGRGIPASCGEWRRRA